jgi:diguanylate cyclase (GGDEF)-like protein
MDTLSPIKDDKGDIVQCVLTSEDFTALKKAQEKIEQLAFYDALTGLPNRRLLHDRMNQAFHSAKIRGNKTALMFLDLDKFKSINDSLGHNAGDELLTTLAKRLENAVRPGDTVARLGGDEFTVVIYSVNSLNDVVHVAERIFEELPKPLRLENQTISITTSMGITLYPDDCEDIETALRNADLAMYHAKSEGRNNFQFYTDEMNTRALGQIDFERQLRQALPNNQFKLYYQPQIDIKTQTVVGVEALIRWFGDDGKIVSPDVFIPIAEESGLILDIGEWVIKQACRDCRRLSQLFAQPITMAINISGHQFKQAQALMRLVQQQIESNSLQSSLIELELTESMLIDDIKTTVEYLNKFRDLGVKLAIDDFGTGYSSLSYLKQFPINRLKIDRSFVNDIEVDQDDAAIASAIIALAHELKIEVLAEGAETEGQLAFLATHQCDLYQGYYFSRPIPMDELIELFEREGLRKKALVKPRQRL